MANQQNDIDIPKAFICPITLTIMEDPVNDDDGNTFDRKAIEESIKQLGHFSPLTRNPITKLTPNRALKELIDKFIDDQLGRNIVAVPPEPQEVDTETDRNGINVILIIDNSGSMEKDCDASGSAEKTNLSRLDLAKHTAKTFLNSLSSKDQFAIISFNHRSTLEADFNPINKITKNMFNNKIENLYAEGGTNIWDALKMAIDISSKKPTEKINILLLTDGESNNDPPRGILPTLADYLVGKGNITINTYGFGNDIKSDLLYNIANDNKGVFGYITDGSMMGTVLINSISYIMDNNKKELSPIEDEIINKFIELIPKNNLTEFMEFISDKLTTDFLKDLYIDCSFSEDVSLGQIEKALRSSFYYTWGKHYIFSVLSAYKNKFCLNFKDKGVQHFKTPEFEKYQKLIETVYIQLPPPVSSKSSNSVSINSQQFSQTFYNASSTVCILEGTLVKVFENDCIQYVPVEQIRKGTCVIVNNKSAFIKCVIKTKHNGPICIKQIYYNKIMSSIGITPYHPIYINNNWVFPVETNLFQQEEINNVYVYNFFLEGNEELHEIELFGGIIASTLNHNKVGPVIEHEYFGTNQVEEDFKKHIGWEDGYIQIESIIAIRDNLTNKVIGLKF